MSNITVGDFGAIQIARFPDATKVNKIVNWETGKKIPFTKYNIKETDMRVKTATFSSPQYLDLTTGLFAVRIVSKYHENFGGIVLDVDYDENTGMYDYQCQDFSRLYISKPEFLIKNGNIYKILINLLTRGALPIKSINAKNRKKFKKVLSGLKPLKYYNQSFYEGNRYKGNPFNKKISFIARDKSFIDLIRDIVFNSLGFFDVYFNDRGVLQIEPLSKKDWDNTGLHLNNIDYSSRKFKFSTTNSITGVVVNGSDLKIGAYKKSDELINFPLNAFFGVVGTSIANPVQQKTTNAVKATNSKSKTSKTSKVKDNPYGNKAKKIWIGADGGSGGFAREIVSLLQKNGWHVHYSGEGAAVHNNDYNNVTSDYQILAIVDNGFCCTTVKEAYEGYCAPTLKRKNVTVMFMFDTRNWTNPAGMKPYRYGDFKGYTAHTAWDDSSGYCTSMNVDSFFRKHKAVYCASPTAKGMVDMFLKGGYYASKGIQV